jgi:hypothetical protein
VVSVSDAVWIERMPILALPTERYSVHFSPDAPGLASSGQNVAASFLPFSYAPLTSTVPRPPTSNR